MTKLDDIPEGSEFTTTVEVDGIRNTLDQFMKKQEQFNDALQKSLNRIANQLGVAPITVDTTTPEDIGPPPKLRSLKQLLQFQMLPIPVRSISPSNSLCQQLQQEQGITLHHL
jgi:hypothetical protein